MLKKMVDGKEVICSAEEEARILAHWAENKKKTASVVAALVARKELTDKIGDVPEFLDKLCRKLGLDPKNKDSW